MATSRPTDFRDLHSRIRSLLGDERNVQVDFLLCLAKFDDVRGYETLEYASLWQYCDRELGLLECAIARRLQAMRILRKYPEAEAYLRDGRLCMTGIGMLEKAFTPENHLKILDDASRKSTREIAAIAVSTNAPVKEKATLRKVPIPAPVPLPIPIATPTVDEAPLMPTSDPVPQAPTTIPAPPREGRQAAWTAPSEERLERAARRLRG